MIKVSVKKDSNIIKNITITGHANYDEYGKDIVCAAVSATVITTIYGIIALEDFILEEEESEDKLIINVKENENISQILLGNMLTLLENLVIKYPKNIKIYY